MRPRLVSLFLQVGHSSGFRLLREGQAGEPHISGQRCEACLLSSTLSTVRYLETCFNLFVFSAAFEL